MGSFFKKISAAVLCGAMTYALVPESVGLGTNGGNLSGFSNNNKPEDETGKISGSSGLSKNISNIEFGNFGKEENHENLEYKVKRNREDQEDVFYKSAMLDKNGQTLPSNGDRKDFENAISGVSKTKAETKKSLRKGSGKEHSESGENGTFSKETAGVVAGVGLGSAAFKGAGFVAGKIGAKKGSSGSGKGTENNQENDNLPNSREPENKKEENDEDGFYSMSWLVGPWAYLLQSQGWFGEGKKSTSNPLAIKLNEHSRRILCAVWGILFLMNFIMCISRLYYLVLHANTRQKIKQKSNTGTKILTFASFMNYRAAYAQLFMSPLFPLLSCTVQVVTSIARFNVNVQSSYLKNKKPKEKTLSLGQKNELAGLDEG